ncbi:MAG: FMN-binding protein [Butyrivibrio sp.]|nr:FMN-binding protein [Butyrivibrio sp.]
MRDFMSMIRNAFILFFITLVAGASLGVVYQVTKDPIAYQETLAQNKANQAVFADAGAFNELGKDPDAFKAVLEGKNGITIESVKEATSLEGQLLGYVIQMKSRGYGDDIVFTVGIRHDGIKNGTINGISIISISETPGLGMNAGKIIVPQFVEKMALRFTVVKKGQITDSGSQIEAISGATITSKAITDGVNVAVAYYDQALKGEQ